jgi:hypothetical protein
MVFLEYFLAVIYLLFSEESLLIGLQILKLSTT